jgi:hypothetical protein
VTWGFSLGFAGGTVKAGREEVEKTAMDVQADQTGLQPEHATIVFERPEAVDHAEPSSDPQNTSYADTDQIPAVRRQSRSRRPDRGAHALRITVAVVAVIVLLAAATLGLVKAGVINLNRTAPPHKAATVHTPTSLPTNTPLLTQTSTSGDSASYTIPIAAYSVTVSTGAARSWVSISPAGHRPAFEGVMSPGQSQHQIMLGPSTIDVGAGGTTVTVTSGKHSQVLKPLAAPFSYQITPKS